jgi:hypothetical protein
MSSTHEPVVAGGRPAKSPDERPDAPGPQETPPHTGAPVAPPLDRSPAAAGREPERATPPASRRGAGQTDAGPVAAASPATGAFDLSRNEPADLLLDVPQLSVDEITLEVQASVGLDHVKLDAKGLDASLFLKASLDNLVALRGGPGRGERDAGVRGGLRRMARALPVADRPPPDAPAAGEAPGAPSGEHAEHRRGEDDDIGTVLDTVRRRAATVAKEGGKAASLAVAGAAGGALLESKRQRRGPRLARALPGRRHRGSGLDALLSTAERVPKALVEGVQQRLP